ncbi:MAG: DUF3891 family protein [Vicinamibacterales bacterium]
MIVRDDGVWYWFITQPDHAALAGRLMAAWQADGLPERATRPAVLHATSRHDTGWAEVDAAPSVHPDTGRPVDFVTAETGVRQAVWGRAVDELASESTYAAALIAQHALTIYRRFRQESEWQVFFAAMESARDHWFSTDRRLDGTRGGALDPPLHGRLTFLQDYATLRLGDLLSLSFCLGIGTTEQADGYEVTSDGTKVIVSPDPFAGQTVALEVHARRLPTQRFASDAALRAALAGAEPVTLTGVAEGRPLQP